MDNIILSAALAFLITFFAIPVIIQVAKDKKLFDEPDERKVHKTVIPTLGGLGIFAGFIIALLMGVPKNMASDLQYFVAAATVIFFLGIKDDILVLSASKKIVGQLIAAGIIIRFSEVRITDMHGFLGLNEIPYVASVILTLFIVIVITNSFNLIDGVDGLAGSLGVLTTLIFGIYFYFSNSPGSPTLLYAVMSFALASGTIAFLIYNFSPAKIFMGDTGSLLLGLVNSILVIKFINIAGSPTAVIPFESAPTMGFAILMIPLFDTLRIFTLRILERRSPFSPDRNHIHHFLLDLGLSHRMVTLTCVGANMGFIVLAYFLRDIGTTSLIGILLFSAFVFIVSIFYRRPKFKPLINDKELADAKLIKSHKIIKLASTNTEIAEPEQAIV